MRMRWLVLAPAVLGAAPIPRQEPAPLEALGFMAGCWRGAVGEDEDIEETWTGARGDVMLATTRYLRGDSVTGWEFSRIQADSSGIHLTPYPDGVARDPFRLDSLSPGVAVFVNARNDFPRSIRYRGDGETELWVRLEGGGREMEWRMRAGACDS
jgi:hypothetical protein